MCEQAFIEDELEFPKHMARRAQSAMRQAFVSPGLLKCTGRDSWLGKRLRGQISYH
jgi:hypothetical protein